MKKILTLTHSLIDSSSGITILGNIKKIAPPATDINGYLTTSVAAMYDN